ncbi:MAG: Ferric reductase domain protein transrane component domain protein [Thermomicrobiales bacterium]|nr:Ferric reductase domain protein transrane component domain protein [Thermomicrobiales bacterium]
MASHLSHRSGARPEPARGYALAILAGSGLTVAALMALAVWLGRSPSPVTWYLARASGTVLYLLVWMAVVTGLGLTTGLLDRWPGRGVTFSLHAFAMQLTYGFLALHLISLAADPTVRFAAKALVVPFATTWREPWTGFGVLAAWLALLIGASFALKRVIGQRAWRALHWLTFPLYALALLHGVGAGTDTDTLWMTMVYLVTASTVVLFGSYRLLRRGARNPAAGSGAERTRRAAVSA